VQSTVRKYRTLVNVEAEIVYEILPEMPEHDLPQQIDIIGVFVDVMNPKTSRNRRTNILDAMGESERVMLEEEIEAEDM
jgi:hypothetical protein